MITKDGRDTAIENLTAENYIVPKGEERFYHAVIEVRQFDQRTGKRLSRPRVQKFGKKVFEESVYASLKKQGYTITILHNPGQWDAEQAALAREAAEKKAQEEAAAKEAEFKDAVDKAVQERLDAAVQKAVEEALATAAGDSKKGPGRPPKDQKEAPAEGETK